MVIRMDGSTGMWETGGVGYGIVCVEGIVSMGKALAGSRGNGWSLGDECVRSRGRARV
jgi:hypothetical protein